MQIGVGPNLLLSDFLQMGFCFSRVIPESRVEGLMFLVLYFDQLAIDVKDTSSGPQRGPLYP
jgi:hypothetical protein